MVSKRCLLVRTEMDFEGLWRGIIFLSFLKWIIGNQTGSIHFSLPKLLHMNSAHLLSNFCILNSIRLLVVSLLVSYVCHIMLLCSVFIHSSLFFVVDKCVRRLRIYLFIFLSILFRFISSFACSSKWLEKMNFPENFFYFHIFWPFFR